MTLKDGLKSFRAKMKSENAIEFDKTFVERLKNKDKAAFEELFGKFGPNLLQYGIKMCGEQEDALDVFQDTLEKAYTSLKQLKEPLALKKWLFKVAANACLMKRRKNKFISDEIELEDVMPEKEDLLNEKDWESLPERILEEKEIKQKLGEIVKSLPDKYKSVLILRDIENFSTEETAEILAISKEAVKMRLSRARAKVREELSRFQK